MSCSTYYVTYSPMFTGGQSFTRCQLIAARKTSGEKIAGRET